MSRAIYVNLAVKDLTKSIGFWKALGFSFNAQFTDEKAACLIFSEQGYAMLLTEPFFRTFTARELCNTRTHCEGIFALSCESRAEVDALMQKALANGGSEPTKPQDHGFMYQRGFDDLDHHHFEVFWMDPKHVQA